MKFEPITVLLKNKKEVIIREATIDDAASVLETVRTYINESDYLLTTSEEFDLTLKKERDWIQSFIDNSNSLLLIAEHEGKIVGNIDLTGGHRNRIRHTALIGISMIKQWQNIGLGTHLMKAAISWAKQPGNPLELLWLMVVGANENAMSLYNKMGFEETGRQKDYFKLSEERYEDNVIMTLQL